MKRQVVFAAFFLAVNFVFGQRETINLNTRWKFTPGWEVNHSKHADVNIPHTWNAQDALSGKMDYYRGIGNYSKEVEVPKEWENKSVFIRFKGVNSIANVFLNGKHIGEHRGGYTAFAFDLTDKLNYGKKNSIMVRASNAMTLDIMPLLGDFNFYGGIYRDVDLIVMNKTHISLSDFGAFGVYFTQENVSEKSAKINAKILIKGEKGGKIQAQVKIINAEGKIVTSIIKDAIIDKNGDAIAEMKINVKNPILWNGKENPYLYRAVSDILKNGKIVDSFTENLGFRFFKVDKEKGVFLNGKKIKLQGVCRHQDFAKIGNALKPENHERDFAIMHEMGVNAIRLAHYPQDRYVYDLADKYGMIVWAEIPFIGPGGYRDKGFVDQPSFKENGKQQLIEMIRQNYNHPSIFFWGLFNELKTNGDNPTQYVRELNDLAHKEDKTRLTTGASNQNDKALNSIPDLICWNQYIGWYGGNNPRLIGNWSDNANKNNHQPIGISEYGAGAGTAHQQEELKQTIPVSYWHPENWQTYFHEGHWKEISQRDFIWGTFVWAMFDFGAAHRREGEIQGINDKGLVTFDREMKKDSFYFYKANWNKADPFVYIAERRLNERKKEKQNLKIYSNKTECELFLNQKSLGVKKGDSGIFLWENVDFIDGKNIVHVKSGKLSDTVEFIKK